MKARDIIPGWPRGRSTSRPLQKVKGRVHWPWQYFANIMTGEQFVVNHVGDFQGLKRKPLGRVVGGGDFCFKHNVSCLFKQCAECVHERAEERRKADMMEAWYSLQRSFVKIGAGHGVHEPWTQRIDGKEYVLVGTTRYDSIPPSDFRAYGVRHGLDLSCGCCPGGKHQW